MSKFISIMAVLMLPIAVIMRVFALLVCVPLIAIGAILKTLGECFNELFDVRNTLLFVQGYLNKCDKIYKGDK